MADNTYASRLLVKTGVTTSTFEDWVDLTNDIVSDMATTVVTVGTTTGNVEIVGVASANTIKADTISGLSSGSVVVTANAEFTGATVDLPAVIVDSLDPSGASLPIGGDVDVQGDISANVATFDTVGALAMAVNGNPVFHDGYHPNADALTTARTISLTGDVSGSVSFDGSANVSITTTVADDSHNHVIANVDGLQTALDGKAALAGSNTQAFAASTLTAANVSANNVTVSSAINGKLVGRIQETAVTLFPTGTSYALSTANGNMFYHTLTGNTTYSIGIDSGESIVVNIANPGGYTVTWPTITWLNNGGTAPALSTNINSFVFYKHGLTIFGAFIGDQA